MTQLKDKQTIRELVQELILLACQDALTSELGKIYEQDMIWYSWGEIFTTDDFGKEGVLRNGDGCSKDTR
jgi:hypothetical protein